MHISNNYSPNFDKKKRGPNQIKFLIFHYTGMKNEVDAINRLTDYKSKVSSHYFIKKNGEIINLVPDLYIAWHAGISSWQKFKSINKYSIGIEISNSGHNYKYKNFSKNQINSISKLSRYLIKKYKIKSKFILGHSDISPFRKKDPGEKFPWKNLSRGKIGIWNSLDLKVLLNSRNLEITKLEKNTFIRNLHKIGYSKKYTEKDIYYKNKITTAFQRRFRQELINGIIDKECLIISKNLIKKFV